MKINESTKMNQCVFRGLNVLYLDARPSKDLPKYLYYYACRHGEWGDPYPSTIENRVRVNFAGTVVSGKEIDLGKDEYIELTEDEATSLTNSELERKTIKEYKEDFICKINI